MEEVIKYDLANKMYRINHESWWKEELPSKEEMELGRKNLEVNDYKVDFVITHCLPTDIQAAFSCGRFKTDYLNNYLMEIIDRLTFTKWYCGQYHDDYKVTENYQIMYNRAREVT